MPIEPVVSIITPFFNPGRFLDEAIDSVRCQSMNQWELLLVDDGSTDESVEIAKRSAASDPSRIRYFKHLKHGHMGVSVSRNLGLRFVRGRYVTFLDADDVYLPDKLAKQVAVMAAHPSVGMLYGNTLYWHTWNADVQSSREDYVTDLGVPLDTTIDPPMLLTLLYPLGVVVAPSLNTVMVRRHVIDRVGGFEDSFGLAYSDQSLLVKLYAQERILVMGDCLDRYRQHSASSSSVVERTGQYQAIRSAFLDWLAGYLRGRAIEDASVWEALRRCRSTQTSLGPDAPSFE